MHIEYRSGADWETLLVNGNEVESGHRIPAQAFLNLLRNTGHYISQPEGNFCAMCGEWVEGLPCNDDERCDSCANEEE